jgi:hypothetical protein
MQAMHHHNQYATALEHMQPCAACMSRMNAPAPAGTAACRCYCQCSERMISRAHVQNTQDKQHEVPTRLHFVLCSAACACLQAHLYSLPTAVTLPNKLADISNRGLESNMHTMHQSLVLQPSMQHKSNLFLRHKELLPSHQSYALPLAMNTI